MVPGSGRFDDHFIIIIIIIIGGFRGQQRKQMSGFLTKLE